jgi:hypothetical protein
VKNGIAHSIDIRNAPSPNAAKEPHLARNPDSDYISETSPKWWRRVDPGRASWQELA